MKSIAIFHYRFGWLEPSQRWFTIMQSLHPLTIFHGQFSGGYTDFIIGLSLYFAKGDIWANKAKFRAIILESIFLLGKSSQNCIVFVENWTHFFTATYNADCEDPYPSLSDFHDYEPNLEFDDSDLLQQKHPENDDGEFLTVF